MKANTLKNIDMLTINNVTKTYTKHGMTFKALDGITFRVEKGDFTVVVGPSGSGKSTLLHTIGGLIRPGSGLVLFKGTDIYKLNNDALNNYRKKNVGFVFQQFHLVPWLTVYENVRLVCQATSCIKAINDYFDKSGLLPLRNKYPSELSVGEKQRTAFIRAIISNPELLLADEPTGNLDPQNAAILMDMTRDFHKAGGTVLLVSHSPETSTYAGKRIILGSGKIL